jgi:hypothetical protein
VDIKVNCATCSRIDKKEKIRKKNKPVLFIDNLATVLLQVCAGLINY